MDCYLPDLPSFLVIQWSLTTVDESPQFLALSPPLMFMSRQIPTTCHVRFEEISSKRSFFQNPSKCKTHYSKGSISWKQQFFGVSLKSIRLLCRHGPCCPP